MYVDLFTNTIHRGTNSQYKDGSYVKEETYEKRDHLLIEQEQFYSSIINNSKAVVDYNDGLNAVYLVTKVNESLDLGKRLSL